MNLSDLHELTTCLSAATLANPFLALCSVTAWLDPLSAPHESFIEEGYYGDGGDDWTNIGVAWEMARTCFPAVYAETSLALRSETDEKHLADQVCTAINKHLVGGELHDLEQIHFGIPFFGRGVDITDPDFFAEGDHTRLPEVYALLGLDFDPAKNYSLPDDFHESAMAADVLAFSLRQTGAQVHEQIAWLLDWMFSQSGNSICDYTDEDIYEMGIQPLMWEPSDLEFNNLMHEEADEIIASAMQGLAVLITDENLQAELCANFQIVTKQLRKEKHHDRHQPDAERLSRGIRWTDRTEHPDDQRSPDDLENLSLRSADAA